MTRMYMVEAGWREEDGCFGMATPEMLGMFDTVDGARAALDAFDHADVWETELSCCTYKPRVLSRESYKMVTEVEVDEDGDIVEYGDIVECESYGQREHDAMMASLAGEVEQR